MVFCNLPDLIKLMDTFVDGTLLEVTTKQALNLPVINLANMKTNVDIHKKKLLKLQTITKKNYRRHIRTTLVPGHETLFNPDIQLFQLMRGTQKCKCLSVSRLPPQVERSSNHDHLEKKPSHDLFPVPSQPPLSQL